MHLRSLFAALSLAVIVPATAQSQDPRAEATIARSRAALAPLTALLGEWEGDAKAMIGPGQTLVVRQHEDVRWASNGTVLVVNGTGRSTEAADRGKIIFQAMAVFWYDIELDRVRMRTFRDGLSIEPELEIKGDTLVWGFPVPGGRVRFTTAFGGDRWHEVGHFLREGAPPVVTVDMPLVRKRP